MTKSTSHALARRVSEAALSKKGFDIKILELKDISSVCDYFVIVSGDADIHVKSIAHAIEDDLMKESIKPYHIEGAMEGNWILMDYIDVVVHIFRDPVRAFYALEKLWGDAPMETITDN